MPVIALTKDQKLNKKVSERAKAIRHLVHDKAIRQKEMAELTGLTQQAISRQLKTGNISFELFCAIEMLAEEKQ